MTPDELKALGENIVKNGLQAPITVMAYRVDGEWLYQLLDGRNRLDAIELVGFNTIAAKRSRGRAERRKLGRDCGLDLFLGLPDENVAINYIFPPDDPYAFIASANIHRRHLTAEQRQDLLIKLIARAPEKSDRQIGEEIGVDHKTIARARTKGEDVGRIPHVSTRTDTKGRQQPAKRAPTSRAKPANKPKNAPAHNNSKARDAIVDEDERRDARKDAEIEELRNAKRRLEIENTGLRSEIEELKTERKPASDSKAASRCSICHEKKQAALRPVFICDNCIDIYEVREAAEQERAR
jgi:ribosomal protein S14